MPRSYPRLCWIALSNGGMLCLLATGERNFANLALTAMLAAGLVLELTRSAAGAALNIGSWLMVPLGWLWERAHDTNFSAHPGEYSISLAIFVAPAVAIAVLNLFLYVSAMRRAGRREV